jgi:hypothetical protein
MLSAGTITASISANAAQDSAGDKSLASNTASFAYHGLSQQGDVVNVMGTPENDNLSVYFLGGVIAFNRFFSGVEVTLNGFSQTYELPFSKSLTVNFNGNGGSDTSVVYGAVGAGSYDFEPGAMQVYLPGVTIDIEQSAMNYLYSAPGGLVQFNAQGGEVATSAPNTFVAADGYSYMTGQFVSKSVQSNGDGSTLTIADEPYENFAVGPGVVYAYALTAADSAYLYAGGYQDVAMTPGYSYIADQTSAGLSAITFADGFENVYAYSGGGNDAAYLYDSAATDSSSGSATTTSATGVAFVGTPAYSYMSGQSSAQLVGNFFNEAVGFANVYAVAQGSGDIAYLDSSSSSGNDLLAFADGAAGIRGSSYENVIQGFGLVYATGSAGANSLAVEANANDAPILQDPTGNPVSYNDGNELVLTGIGITSQDLEAGPVAALDFVLQQLGSWSG